MAQLPHDALRRADLVRDAVVLERAAQVVRHRFREMPDMEAACASLLTAAGVLRYQAGYRQAVRGQVQEVHEESSSSGSGAPGPGAGGGLPAPGAGDQSGWGRRA